MLSTRIRHAKRRSRSYSPRDHASTIRLTAYLGVLVLEEHRHHLLAAMRRWDLRNDPRFKTNADRVAHLDETDTFVGKWTQILGKMEVFTITKWHPSRTGEVVDSVQLAIFLSSRIRRAGSRSSR